MVAVCDWCGCQTSVGGVGELTGDHEVIRRAILGCRRAIRSGDGGGLSGWLEELAGLVLAHAEREESGLFLRLAAVAQVAEAVATLEAEHRQIETALTLAGQDGDLDSVTATLDLLERHIEMEEHDLFPAAAQYLPLGG